MNTRALRFPQVDSLRAVAALWVLFFHAAFITEFVQLGTPAQGFLAFAGTAPMLFFAISGFLLYRPFAQAHIGQVESPHVGRYAWGRVLRIGPAYWVALTLVALVLGLDDVLSLPDALLYYGFGQIYSLDAAFNGIQQAWTLAVEVTFYALLPLWALLVRSLRIGDERRRFVLELAGLALLFLASVAYKVWMLRRHDPSSLTGGAYFVPLPNYVDAFAVGMVLAVVSVWHERHRAFERSIAWIRDHTIAIWVVAVVLASLGGFWLGFTAPGDTLTRAEFLVRWELQVVVALLMMLPAAFADARSGEAARYGGRTLAFVALVSYGLYLYHYAVIDLIDEHVVDPAGGGATVSFLVVTALALPIGLALAAASYYAIERPALSLKRLFGRPPRSPGEATAEPAEPAPASPSAEGAAR